jgi:transcriptional regulator with XRE-family HTH domain
MKKTINSNGIASRLKAIRIDKKLTTLEMATQLGTNSNNYRKYERGMFLPKINIQLILAQKFGISLDWLILNKGPMYSNQIETIFRENEQRKQAEQQMGGPVPQDAMIVTSPEIKDLLRFMEENPGYKFQLLNDFYRYKQEGQKAGEISFEDNRQS